MSRLNNLDQYVKENPMGQRRLLNGVKFNIFRMGHMCYLDVYRPCFINCWVPLFNVQEALETLCLD